MKMQPELSIIIVNYRSPDLVNDCIASVLRHTRELLFEIIVVDNDSGDDSRSQVLSVFPEVMWIQMSYNSGFARANNEGIRQSQGNIILLLNSDTLVENDAIGGCYRLFAASFYGACGVQLLNTDRTPQISGNYFMKGGLNYILPLPYLGNFVKRTGQLLKVSKPNVPNAESLVEVDWINGAFLMVKRQTVNLAGLMDEDFFLYFEETEWCSRLRKRGKLAIYGQFHVVHLQGASANETFGSEGKGYYNLYDRKGLQIMLSSFVRIRKQYGSGWFLVMLTLYILEVPVFLLGVLLTRLFMGHRGVFSFTQFRQFYKNIMFIAGKSSVILRNKPYFYKVL
jgi:GT2 family glycosyltransferase